MSQIERFRGAFSAMPRRAQLVLLIVAVVTIFAVFFVIKAATATKWITVSEGLRPEQSAKARKALESEQVNVKLTDNATVVQVPEAQQQEAIAALATAGIAARGSHTTCETAFGDAKGSIVATTKDQHQMRERTCLQNEIANAIERIDGIQSATVNIAFTKEELFAEEESKPTAGITIDTAGNGMARSQVRAIAQLASNMVSGLAVDDVSIVDESGTLLSESAGPGGLSLTESQLKLQIENQFNQQKEALLTSKFEEIAGEDKVKVISNVELDMDSIRREVKDVGGAEDNQGPRAAEDLATGVRAKSGDGGVQGVAGIASNVNRETNDDRFTGIANAAGGEADSIVDETKVTYDNDEVREAIDVAQGSVKRYRMSVIIDSSVKPDTANAVKNAAQAWMGGNADDSFSFDIAKLAVPSKKAADSAANANRFEGIGSQIRWGLLGLALLVMAFFLRRSLNRRTRELLESSDDALLLESGFEPIPIKELEAAVAAASTMDTRRRVDLQQRVESIAVDKPQDVAQMLRGWLNEGEQQRYVGRGKS